MGRRASSTIGMLEEHPNLAEILGVLAQLAHIRDDEIPRLAEAWCNTIGVAEARDRALSPDSPLVLEALSAFEAVGALFEDDLRGEAGYITVGCDVTTTALKAVRDAIAAAYAKPCLSRTEYTALLRPWRTVYPASTVEEPDLGPRAEQVKELLALLPLLSTRCHDAEGRRLYDALVDRSFTQESDRAEAREAAFQAAVLTSRRRVWALVRRSGAEGLSRPCASCRASVADDRENQRVMSLCLDAACALLVADALPDATTSVLTEPVTSLIPQQRGPSS
ncbi:MAG: hypothetical protein LC789_12805 [Actinobacteria bacterium]|nr:hypothetical protein [Actinomycetota bacterium]MCA1719950.1 hypothetical protein [Actinomycetota bacterium]